MSKSLAETLCDDEDLRAYIANLSDAECEQLLRDWLFWARPEQIAPIRYLIWLILTGRGWGKTRTGAETICDRIQAGKSRAIGFIAATAADARDTMVDELRENAGLLTVAERRGMRFMYVPSKRLVVFPQYRAYVRTFSAEEPERLRGPQFDTLWFDELAAYPKAKLDATWSNAMFGLRHGEAVTIITTTPKPLKKLREIIALPNTVVTEGSTFDNMSNLSPVYINEVVQPFIGTRLGRQELEGKILLDNPDALFTEQIIERNRIQLDDLPDLDRVVVGVDPSGSTEGHECGIVVAGRSRDKLQGTQHGYCLADYSLQGSPEKWATQAIQAYDDYMANAIVVETNYGGEMVEATIRLVAKTIGHDPVRIRRVTATRGKTVRAEPVSGYSEQNRVHHVGNPKALAALEEQLCDFDGLVANDRVDAYVWAFTDLLVKAHSTVGAL